MFMKYRLVYVKQLAKQYMNHFFFPLKF